MVWGVPNGNEKKVILKAGKFYFMNLPVGTKVMPSHPA